jgi:hypothetical protein
MKLIFIYGLPAVGKLTVAKELAAITGYRLFYNHLAVDMLLSVFDFGSDPFIETRESVWLSVFDQAGKAGLPGLIFTFAPENTVRQRFIDDTLAAVSSNGGRVYFVQLVCSDVDIEKRLDTESRHEYRKLTSVEFYRQLRDAKTFDVPKMPAPDITVDTSIYSPAEAAALIAEALALISITRAE